MIYGAMLMAILLIYIIFGAFTIENMDLPLALTGLLGLYLLTCAYAAIGLFMSSITSYQVVAAINSSHFCRSKFHWRCRTKHFFCS